MKIKGGPSNDYLVGTEGSDLIRGLGGNDVMDAGPGGNDTLLGGDGDDVLLSQNSADHPRNIVFDGGDGNDDLYMSDGISASVFQATGGDGDDAIFGQGMIVAVVDAGAGDDRFACNGGHYVLTLGAGRDLVSPSFRAGGFETELTITDFATAGASEDRLDFTSTLIGASGWTQDTNPFATGFWRLIQEGGDAHLQQAVEAGWIDLAVLQGVQASDLTAANLSGFATDGSAIVGMTLVGGDGPDDLVGGFGDDSLDGGTGNDALRGEFGDDTLVGGGGADSYYDYQGGDDLMIGGDSYDNFDIRRIAGTLASSLTVTGGAGDDQLNYVNAAETIVHAKMGDGEDTILAIGGGVQASLGGGDDLVITSGGAGVYLGGAGEDWLSFESADQGVSISLADNGAQDTGVGRIRTTGFEKLIGSDYADLLVGEKHANHLTGGAGADTLVGGKGADILWGLAGADTYAYGATSDSFGRKVDLITELEASDAIDLTAIDADMDAAGDQAFHKVDAFSGHAGELVVRYDDEGGVTLFSGDVDGDGVADLVISAGGYEVDFAGLAL